MPSTCDIILAVNITQAGFIIDSKMNWLPSLFSDQPVVQTVMKEKVSQAFAKTSVHPPKSFTGNIKDWKAQKKRTRSIFGLKGLLDVIDDLDYVAGDPSKNTTVHHLLSQAAVHGVVSSFFSGP